MNSAIEGAGGGTLPARDDPLSAPLRAWRTRTPVRRIALLLLILAAWQAVALLLRTDNLPTVPHFLAAAVQVLQTAEFWSALALTGAGWAAGLAVSAILGIGIGILIGVSTVLDRATRIPIAVFYAVPSITLVPLFLLLFGSTMQMKIIITAIAVIWPVILHAQAGVREVDAVARATARSYRLPHRHVVLYLYLPSAVPIIATGIRIAASISLQIAIACEVVAGVPGLGSRILLLSINSDDPAPAFVYFMAAATLGLCIALGFRRIERAALFWHPSQRKGRGR